MRSILYWDSHMLYFSYYLGRKPVVVVADPDMLRQVMVRDFSSFPNRMVMTLTKAFRCAICAFFVNITQTFVSVPTDYSLFHQTNV